MTEKQFKEFYMDFYTIAYYSNRANFAEMSYESRRKYEDWLCKELKKMIKKYEFSACGITLMRGMITALVDYMARKIDMEYKNGNGIKVKNANS